MKNWSKKLWFHFLLLAVLVIYLFTANGIFVRYFLNNGKPAREAANLTAAPKSVSYAFDSFQPTQYKGEQLYELVGWSFVKPNPDPANQSIKIVLHSTSHDLIYDTEPVARPDVTQAYPDYKTNLNNAGFSAFIAKDALKIDNYQIGILIEDKQGNPLAYMLTGRYIERSPNTLRYIGP